MMVEQYYFWSLLISGVAAILTLIGLIFACVQLWQIRKNRKDQYDNSRRAKTVELVYRYTQDLSDETKAVEKIVSKLSNDQCKDLYNYIPFEIDARVKSQLCGFCPYRKECKRKSKFERALCEESRGKYYVKGDLLYFMRGRIIAYLNSLECVLLAWQLGIVDRPALEEQFDFLDRKGSDERAAAKFRIIAGNGSSYPAIEKYYQSLDQKRIKKAKKSLKDTIK